MYLQYCKIESILGNISIVMLLLFRMAFRWLFPMSFSPLHRRGLKRTDTLLQQWKLMYNIFFQSSCIVEQKIMYKAACYCRLSDDDLNDRMSISIETQIIISENKVIISRSKYNMMLHLRSVINEMLPAEVFDKVRQAFEGKSKNGEFLHPWLPYGYIKS